MRGKSILQSERACYVTGAEFGLDVHHIFQGALRKVSDREGFWVYLRHDVHMAAHERRDPYTTLIYKLRAKCQAVYEETHTREQWMALIGRNYL